MRALIVGFALFAMLDSAPSAPGAEPKAKISGPVKTVCGLHATFRSDKSENVKRRRWKVVPMPDSIEEFDGGATLVIGSIEPLSMKIELTVTSDDGELAEMEVEHQFLENPRAIRVTHEEEDGTSAAPIISATPVETRQLAIRWARTIKTPNVKREAGLVADALRDAKAKVATSQIDNPEDLVRYTAKCVKTALGDSSWAVWQGGFFEEFQDHLSALADAGFLGTMGAHEDVWLDAAKGLEKFAGK